MFFTVRLYCAPVWFWKKLPLCVFVRIRSGGPLTAVTSLAESLVASSSPPPETVALLVTLAGAFGATFTRSVAHTSVLLSSAPLLRRLLIVANVQVQLLPAIA